MRWIKKKVVALKMSRVNTYRMKTARTIINILIELLIVVQILAYLGNLNQSIQAKVLQLFGYYIGLHFPLMIALILLRVSFYLRHKIRKKEQENIVHSIGKS